MSRSTKASRCSRWRPSTRKFSSTSSPCRSSSIRSRRSARARRTRGRPATCGSACRSRWRRRPPLRVRAAPAAVRAPRRRCARRSASTSGPRPTSRRQRPASCRWVKPRTTRSNGRMATSRPDSRTRRSCSMRPSSRRRPPTCPSRAARRWLIGRTESCTSTARPRAPRRPFPRSRAGWASRRSRSW